MNESPIQKFCESSHRKLIVVIVTTVIGLAVLVPLTDDYFDKKGSGRALAEELDRARQTAKMMPTFEERVMALAHEMGDYDARLVSQKSISQYRNKIVELIRESDCQVRRFEVSSPLRRPWIENDNPLDQTEAKGPAIKKTSFTLVRRSVALTVDGTMGNIIQFLEKLQEDNTFAYVRRLDLRRVGQQGGAVAVELELWLFALNRNKTA